MSLPRSTNVLIQNGLGKAEQIFWGLGFRFSSTNVLLARFRILPAGGLGECEKPKIQNSIGAFVHTIILMFMIKENQTLGIRLGQFR
jgi:hypothetical protein